MYILHGDFPLIGQYLPDKTNQQERIPFKCRIVSDAPQFFTTVLGGLMDIGTNLTIVTPKAFRIRNRSKSNYRWCNVFCKFCNSLYSRSSSTRFRPTQTTCRIYYTITIMTYEEVVKTVAAEVAHIAASGPFNNRNSNYNRTTLELNKV